MKTVDSIFAFFVQLGRHRSLSLLFHYSTSYGDLPTFRVRFNYTGSKSSVERTDFVTNPRRRSQSNSAHDLIRRCFDT